MAPTLAKANGRRWWIAATAVTENLMFAAVLLGWSSLLLMLKNEGFYSSVCTASSANLTGVSGLENSSAEGGSVNFSTASNSSDQVTRTPSGFLTCGKQDEILNRYFSIGSSLLSAVTIILGVIMDRYGSRMIRLSGTFAFMISCLLFAVGSMDTEHLSGLMAPAVCLNGMGGITYIFTSFPIPNFFEDLRSTMISLMIGSYSASAVVYMFFKAAYDAGVSFQGIMLFHASLGFFTYLNAYFNVPGEPIPGPTDITYAVKFRFGGLRYEHKITGQQFQKHTRAIGRRMSSVDFSNNASKTDTDAGNSSVMQLGGEASKQGEEQESFLKVLATPCIWLSIITMCLTQLRLIAYMGWLELYVKSAARKIGYEENEISEQVDYYAQIFGLMQINCFLMAPVIGTIMDWKLKTKKPKKKVSMNGNTRLQNLDSDINPEIRMERKVRNKKKQHITNLFRAFLITNLLMTIFGIIILFETNLPLQIFAFFLHTVIRTFLHSSTGSLYACMYHFSHFGKLTGLASFLSAMFILVQDPLFVFINSSLGGDPYWVNFALLILSVTGFALPCFLWRAARNEPNYEPLLHGNDKELFCIAEAEDGGAEDEANGSGSSSTSDVAVYVSNGALVF